MRRKSAAAIGDWVCIGPITYKGQALLEREIETLRAALGDTPPSDAFLTTALIEHPQLVADRIQRFARMVGRENVIASTDCGLGLRWHSQVAWAKLRALADGAALATEALWRKRRAS